MNVIIRHILLVTALAAGVPGFVSAQVTASPSDQARLNQVRRTTLPAPTEDISTVKVARLHYGGGGDWYWGNSAVPNFLGFVRDNSDYPVDTIERVITITDPDLFRYPFLFATGHGVIDFSNEEKERLRLYLANGGFLFVNDSYGMERTFLKELADLFPEREVVQLPFDHDLYHCFYDFPNGPPKIHEHDKQAPRGHAVILNGRVVLYFLVESDIGDGWEDPQVHNDPPDKRLAALRMGLNILTYALFN
ncbi:MAG: DUF4159 domain-containing protein [bacterium]